MKFAHISSLLIVLGLLPVGVEGCSSASVPPSDPVAGPWYDTKPSDDDSYLPLGSSTVSVLRNLAVNSDEGSFPLDVYRPTDTTKAPVVLFLPGALVTKARYSWLGKTLASHGIVVAIPQARGGFVRSFHSSATLQALAAWNAASDSPLSSALDLSRVLLAGHSQGALVQAGLADYPSCPPGFCREEDLPPAGLRGLMLMGFHAENTDRPDLSAEPIGAAEVPWLLLTGSLDGLATPEKVSKTFGRLQDRPVTVVEVQGMNHFQFTDYVDPKTDAGLSRDKAPTLGNKEARAAAADYALAFAKQVFAKDKASTDPFGAKLDNRVRIQSRALRFAVDVPTTFGRVVARPFGPLGIDGRVDNSDIVATQSFQGKTYLLVRNSATGPEIWSLGGQDLTKVELPAGLAGSGRLSSLFGAMTAFRDKLFVAFSTGFQGASRAGSTGAELWSFDGKSWAPVVSRFGDADREVHVAACKPGPGKAVTLTLQETLSTPPTQGSLDDVETAAIDSAAIFEVLQGSGTSLVVQSNETAGDGAGDADGTTCASFAPGKAWNLRSGLDESGFGTPWNKAITSLVVYGDKLYASTGLNYDKGPSLFASSDGKTFAPVLDQTVFGTKGTAPISSSISAMTVSNVDGTDKLYIASNGIDGYGARLGTLDSTGTYMWLVDASVDGDSSGFDEAGLGRNTNQISSMVTFQGRLWLGTFDYNGAEILSLAKTSGANWDWRVDVGQDGPLPRGFGDTNQFATNLAVAQNQLWVGTVLYAKRAGDLIEGSGFGARTDGTTWQLASTHAYRLNAVAVSRYFEHEGKLMAVAARGSLTSRTAFGAAQLYTLTDVSNALPQGEKAP